MDFILQDLCAFTHVKGNNSVDIFCVKHELIFTIIDPLRKIIFAHPLLKNPPKNNKL